MEHFCCRDTSAPGMVSYGFDSDKACGKPAHFCEKYFDDAIGEMTESWYCAECWDFYVAWNRMVHEKYGVPLLE